MKCDENKGRSKERQGGQQVRFERVKRGVVLKYPLLMRIAMGLDGGGTKTDCVLMDEAGRVLARGRGRASNPSRIGIELGARGVREAAMAALADAGLKMQQVTDVCAGLAGVALAERAAAMSAELRAFFGAARFELCTDLDLALTAAGTAPAIVLVAGTGSVAIGRDAAGRVARSGGYGPKMSDEGSAFAIGKLAISEATTGANESAKNLRKRILEQLKVDSLEKIVGLDGEEADAIYPRVFPVIANAADEGNEAAQKILEDAAETLAGSVAAVQKELKLSGTAYFLGKTGGMIGRSQFFDEALDKELRRVAPLANVNILQIPLAEVAARRALSL
jgi:N-acetylglucosamine kinase-like BadF-type ATPase